MAPGRRGHASSARGCARRRLQRGALTVSLSPRQRSRGRRPGERGVSIGLGDRGAGSGRSASTVRRKTSAPWREYRVLNSTAPFSSSTTSPPSASGMRSMPTRSASTRGRGADRQLAGLGRRLDRLANGTERDVRPPLAGRGDALDRADHGAAGDDEPEVVAQRRDELLDERAVAAEPGPVDDRGEARRSAAASSQRTTSRPQLPKRGLTTTGGSSGTLSVGAVTCVVRGWATPASPGRSLVASLSCAATSVPGRFRTWTPAPSSRASSQRPISIPSRLSATSSRPMATSPSPSVRAASSGSRMRMPGRASVSATFVLVRWWATIATCMGP